MIKSNNSKQQDKAILTKPHSAEDQEFLLKIWQQKITPKVSEVLLP
jgi:hypothetical protein